MQACVFGAPCCLAAARTHAAASCASLFEVQPRQLLRRQQAQRARQVHIRVLLQVHATRPEQEIVVSRHGAVARLARQTVCCSCCRGTRAARTLSEVTLVKPKGQAPPPQDAPAPAGAAQASALAGTSNASTAAAAAVRAAARASDAARPCCWLLQTPASRQRQRSALSCGASRPSRPAILR